MTWACFGVSGEGPSSLEGQPLCAFGVDVSACIFDAVARGPLMLSLWLP